MPYLSKIQNCCSHPFEKPNSFSISEAGFSCATLAIGGVGVFLLATHTLLPLGISLTVVSGTGALGLVAFAIFRRCIGGSSEYVFEEDDEESHPRLEKKSQQEEKVDSSFENVSKEDDEESHSKLEKKSQEEKVDSSFENVSEEDDEESHSKLEKKSQEEKVDSSCESVFKEIQESPEANAEKMQIVVSKKLQLEESKMKNDSLELHSFKILAPEDALPLGKSNNEREFIRICQMYAGSVYTVSETVEKLISVFKKMSYQEVENCFSLRTNNPSWFRWDENPKALPPRRVISFSLIGELVKEFSGDPQWITALFAGIEDEKEIAKIVSRAEGGFNQVKIGPESPQGRMLQVLRENNKGISILKELDPISLSHVVANLLDTEVVMLLSLLVEFRSEALATKEQIENENKIRGEKIQWILYALTDNAWKSLDAHWHSFKKLNSKEIDRSWDQLKEAMKLLANVSSNQFALALVQILKTMDQNMPRWFHSYSDQEVQQVIDNAEKTLEGLVKEIGPHYDQEFETSLRETFWKKAVEESLIYFLGPLTARMAIRLEIWEGKEKGFKKVSRKLCNIDWVRFVVPMFREDQLAQFIDLYSIEKLKNDPNPRNLSRVIEHNAAIFEGLSPDQRKKYFPNYELEISESGTRWLKEKTNQVEELEDQKLITDK